MQSINITVLNSQVKYIRFVSLGSISRGQYGHFNLFPCERRCRASFEITCPHTSVMGGLLCPHCCRRIGHAKIEWKWKSRPSSISTGSSSFAFHIPSTCRCCITCRIWSNVGRAMHPAVTLVSSGLLMERPRRKHASFVNWSLTSIQFTGSRRSAYGDAERPPFFRNAKLHMRRWISLM